MLAAALAQFVDPNPASGNHFGSSVVPLSTGNVVVTSPGDDAAAENAGAVYLFNGETGDLISTLTGSTAFDSVGRDGVTPLANGNFVITSTWWHNRDAFDIPVSQAGAVTWGSGTTGVSGVVSAANSLVGGTSLDRVGGGGSSLNFHAGVVPLSNGNYVVRSVEWDRDAGPFNVPDVGAVTFGNGATGTSGLVSEANSLVGSFPEDFVGEFIDPLSNGNYVVRTRSWDTRTAENLGAVTFANGATGITGAVSAANSLVGSKTDDRVGTSFTELANGNYIVSSYFWDNGAAVNAGAVTWADGDSGVVGAVGAANSLVGSTAEDRIGVSDVTALNNGNYVVHSPFWTNGAAVNAGAITFANGAVGIAGAVSAANSLVGSSSEDRVGGSITQLANGNFVVENGSWSNGPFANVGAATWVNGATGITGVVSAANSLVGSAADDRVGGEVIALANGNYVVKSEMWDNGVLANAGAATWGNGTTGITGVVSAANSLVGSSPNDSVGRVVPLTNGNYVVSSSAWDNGAIAEAGAVTWGDGATGASGVVSAANSLVGTTERDFVGEAVTVLTNGNYVVRSPMWDNGGTIDVGAVTWGDGTTGVSGAVSSTNSLVGATAEDHVGGHVTELTNGNYVVSSSSWDNGSAVNAGAATWGNGATGITGPVTSANSLVGSTTGDFVSDVIPLQNGNYLVAAVLWDNAMATEAGAVTFGNGATGVSGGIDSSNSLIGTATNDRIGSHGVFELMSGGYVVLSARWDNGAATDAGAVSFGDGSTGVAGIVSGANSLIGSTADDRIGGFDSRGLSPIVELSNGNYVIRSVLWDNGSIVNAGAVTFGDAASGVKGEINSLNSVVNTVSHSGSEHADVRIIADDGNGTFFAAFLAYSHGATGATSGVVRVGSQDDGFFVPPVIDSFGGNLTYAEDADPILISPAAVVNDLNDGNLTGARLIVSISAQAQSADQIGIRTVGTGAGEINVQGNQVRLGSIVLGDVSGGSGSAPLVVTFTHEATAEGVQALLRSITFTHHSENPSTAPRTVRVVLSDGDPDGQASVPVTKRISIAPANDAPQIASLGGAISYTENAQARSIYSTATVSDADSLNFAGGQLRVRIASGAHANDRIVIRTIGNISTSGNEVLFAGQPIGTFSGGIAGTALAIIFNSQATAGRVQGLLRAIGFASTSENPPEHSRTVELRIGDGDGGSILPLTKQIAVTRLNDAPVLTPENGGSVDYVRNDPPTALLSSAVLADKDHPNFAGGFLLVRAISGLHSSNQLLIFGGFTVVGNDIKLNDVTIGTKNTNGGVGTTRLEITFNANATISIVQRLIRGIRFSTTVTLPTDQRVFEFYVRDVAGGNDRATVAVNTTSH